MESLIALTVPLCGGVGVGIRYLWERTNTSKLGTVQLAIEETQCRLDKFYMPIYFHLKETEYIWNEYISRGISIDENNFDYDKKYLEILIQIQDIIHEHITIARPNQELSEIFLRFDEYVTVYRIMRETGSVDRDFPLSKGYPYPDKFQKTVNRRVRKLGMELNKLYKNIDKLYDNHVSEELLDQEDIKWRARTAVLRAMRTSLIAPILVTAKRV